MRGEGKTGDAVWQQWLLWLFLFAGIFLGPAAWTAQHAVFFGLAGLLVIVGGAPRVSRGMVWLAGVFILCLFMAFLPASLFSVPQWRKELAGLGIASDSQVIQRGMALEMALAFALTVMVGLWVAGRRFCAGTSKRMALVFTVGVAAYALLSWLLRDQLAQLRGKDHFGFFPNRNHSATSLVMGGVCGMGCLVQSIREKRGGVAIAAAVALVIIFVGLIFWSESRAGIVLLVAGMAAFALLAGRSALGGNTGKALGLAALLGIGLFAVGSSDVKERLVSTIVRSSSDDSSNADFRVPTWLDTLAMIKDAPLPGVGAGQFRFVFPQYRGRTSAEQFADSYHPESDWLWIAAESGVPAAVALFLLVGIAAAVSIRKLKEGRGRTVRAACLVAALVIPLHGFFDVPGHRAILAWTGCWLFALSLPPLEAQVSVSTRWFQWLPWKSLGGASVLAGIFLGAVTWFGTNPPAIVAADHALREAELLVRKDKQLRADAHARGDAVYDPHASADPLEDAYDLLGNTVPTAPLDRRLYGNRGMLGLQFDGRDDDIDRFFAIERTLAPRRIDIPLKQGGLWAPIDSTRAKKLWLLADQTAKELDERLGFDGKFTKEVANRVRAAAKPYPELRNFANSMDTNQSAVPK